MLYIKLIFTILKYGTSYAIATAFFPKLIRDKILLLYAFVREPDNIVDEPSTHLDHHYALSKQKLETLYKERSEAHHKLTVADPKR
jgi:phytoene/squalene synthetase